MRVVVNLVLAWLLLGASAAQAAGTEKRVALVVGNSDYAHTADLANPANDAADISKALKRLGFSVTQHENLGYDRLRRTLRDFGKKASGADMALFFFAGHGMELNKQNYLIPTDAKLESDDDIEFEAIPLDLVSRSVSGAKELRLVLLDACRNNPFLASMKRSGGIRAIGRGFARYEPNAGTLVSYAAREGTTADDGDGRNSPYTNALLAHLEEPGLEVQFLFRKVRDSVLRDTAGKQEPFTYGSLPGKRLYLKPPVEVAPAADKTERERIAWAAVRDSENISALRRFIARNPDSKFLAPARERIEQITQDRKARRLREREAIAWSIVKDTKNLALLRNFLQLYPGGDNAPSAREQIAVLEKVEQAKLKTAAETQAALQKRKAAEEAQSKAESRKAARQLQELSEWSKLQTSNDLIALQAFINRFPSGPFSDLAKARLEAAKRRQIAALQSQTAIPAPETGSAASGGLVIKIQRNLYRLGCYEGEIDGAWGPGSRRALKDFSRKASVQLASLEPSPETLNALIRQKTRICPNPVNAVLPDETGKATDASRFDGIWRLTKKSSRCRGSRSFHITVRGGKVLMSGGGLNKNGTFKFKGMQGRGSWFHGRFQGNSGSGSFGGGSCIASLVRISE